jgi:hypothetical protein
MDRPAFTLVSAALCVELECGNAVSYPLAAWLDRGAHTGARAGSTRPVRALAVSAAA